MNVYTIAVYLQAYKWNIILLNYIKNIEYIEKTHWDIVQFIGFSSKCVSNNSKHHRIFLNSPKKKHQPCRTPFLVHACREHVLIIKSIININRNVFIISIFLSAARLLVDYVNIGFITYLHLSLQLIC